MEEKIQFIPEEKLAFVPYGTKATDTCIFLVSGEDREVYYSALFMKKLQELLEREVTIIKGSLDYWISRGENLQSELNLRKSIISNLDTQLSEANDKIQLLSDALARSKENESKLIQRLNKCQTKKKK